MNTNASTRRTIDGLDQHNMTVRFTALTDKQGSQCGFSLMELLTTIGVGALLISVGLPGLTEFTKNASIVSSSNTFLGDMHYARDLAVTRNSRVVLCPSDTGQSCNVNDWAAGWIVYVDDNNNSVLDVGETIERVGEGLSGLSVQPVKFGNSLTFRPSGRVMGATVGDNFGAFLLCDDRGAEHARAVVIEVSGRPRVSHLAQMGVTAPCPTT